jgi:putative addiction module component (TIGR02574 family)
MARDLTDLFQEASKLSESEDVEAAWAEEVERRVREIDRGEVKTIPWEDVRAKLYALRGLPLGKDLLSNP